MGRKTAPGHCKRWSAAHIIWLRRNHHLPLNQLSERLGRTELAIKAQLYGLGYKPVMKEPS